MGHGSDDLPHGVVMPPLAYGGVLVVTAIVQVFAPARVLPAGSMQFAVGLPVIALGLAILFWAFFALRSVGEHPEPGRPTEAIATAGPYVFSRNPNLCGLHRGGRRSGPGRELRLDARRGPLGPGDSLVGDRSTRGTLPGEQVGRDIPGLQAPRAALVFVHLTTP